MMPRRFVLLFAFCGLANVVNDTGIRSFASEPPSQATPLRRSSSAALRPLRDEDLPTTPTTKTSKITNIAHVQEVFDTSKGIAKPDIKAASIEFETSPALLTLQTLETTPVDMAGVFALIGVRNPDFLAAQQRVLEAAALRQLAAVQLLPTINLGSGGSAL